MDEDVVQILNFANAQMMAGIQRRLPKAAKVMKCVRYADRIVGKESTRTSGGCDIVSAARFFSITPSWGEVGEVPKDAWLKNLFTSVKEGVAAASVIVLVSSVPKGVLDWPVKFFLWGRFVGPIVFG